MKTIIETLYLLLKILLHILNNDLNVKKNDIFLANKKKDRLYITNNLS